MKTETNYKPVRFFLITFLITWISWFIAAYYSYQEGMDGIQLLFMIPGLFAPFITVLIMISGAKNKPLRKDFWERLSLFFIHGYYQNQLWNTGIVYTINFFVQVLAATVLMNWMYYKNNRSITASILFHFIFNLFSVLFQTEQFTKCIITVILLIISVIVIVREKELFFDNSPEEALQ
jgi:uncharacterized membrane protein YhfC